MRASCAADAWRRRALLRGLGAVACAPSAAAVPAPSWRAAVLPYAADPSPQARARSLDAEWLQTVATRAGGAPLEFVSTTVSRLWNDLAQGQVAFSAGVAWLPEREAQADYLVLSRQRALVLMRREQAAATPTREAFDADPRGCLGVLRAARRGAQAQAWVDLLRSQGRVREALDMPSLHRAFAAGRVQAMLMLPLALEGRSSDWWAAHRMPDWLPQDRIVSGIAASHHAVEAAWRQRLRDAAEALRRDGTLQRIADRHLGAAARSHFEVLPVSRSAPLAAG